MNQQNSTNDTDSQEHKRVIAYSMDALIPGLYIWRGSINFRIGGSQAEKSYPGTIHSSAGIALVIPGYKIWSTYQGHYDLDKRQIDGIANNYS